MNLEYENKMRNFPVFLEENKTVHRKENNLILHLHAISYAIILYSVYKCK